MIFRRTEIRRRIGLFGGSFNPPHLGHTAICKWLFNRGIVDEVWVIPCFIHPFGKELISFEDRFAMCKLAFGKLALPIKILDVERELGGVSYTLRTVEHLKAKHPDFRFLLVTGDDVQKQTSGWHEFSKIKEIVEIVRIPRGENSPIPDISSTSIRHRMSNNESNADLLEPEVRVYIITNGLFR